MKLLQQQVFRFEGIEIDRSQSCLTIGGQQRYIRQQLLQLLVYLIEQRHRVVSKNDLIETIWEGTSVTDDALVQAIKELRRSLGDDPRQPRFIKTIPKIGYRFIAAVEELCLNDVTTIHIEDTTSVEVEYEEIANQAPGQSGAAIRGAISRRLAALSPRLRVALTVVLITLLASVVAAYFVQRQRQNRRQLTEVSLPHLPGKRSVVVMHFDNQSVSADLEWLREGLADMLISNLSRSKRLNVLGRQQLHLLLERMGHRQADAIRLDEALEIGRKNQVEIILLGSFARLGEKIRVNTQFYVAQTGQPLAYESMVADKPEEIFTQIDLLSLKLAAHLGASADEPEESRSALTGLMTNSLDAYRYYSLALEEAQMFQFNEAIALLEKALALDPQFAMAYARIGYIYAVRMGSGDKARPYLEKALQLSEQLPGRLNERDKLHITAWSAGASYDLEQAIIAYRELLALYPLETEAYQQLGWLLQRLNRNEEALQVLQQGVITDPEAKDLYNALGSVYNRLARNDEALAAFQHYTQLTPRDPNAWDSLALFHQRLGQYEQATAAYQHALALNPESRIAIIHLGNLYFQQGRYQAALEQYQRHFQIARDDFQRARSFAYIASVYLKQGDLPRAAAAINKEVKYNPKSLWTSLVLALARGDQTAVQRLSPKHFTPESYNFCNERGFLRLWNYQRGYVALKQGRSEEAINHFRAAVQHWSLEWNYDSVEDCLANAYLEVGRLDEAISEYERILSINPQYPLAHYHLAQAYEGKGEADKARASYAEFLQIWKQADPDLREMIVSKNRLK
jgi:tetratricopeptide (TPR) repeat protein